MWFMCTDALAAVADYSSIGVRQVSIKLSAYIVYLLTWSPLPCLVSRWR